MSDFDERGRRIPDDDERREAWEARHKPNPFHCLCGYPDMPGNCPGPQSCPMHGEEV